MKNQSKNPCENKSWGWWDAQGGSVRRLAGALELSASQRMAGGGAATIPAEPE